MQDSAGGGDVTADREARGWTPGWYRRMPGVVRLSFWACMVGWAVDSFDLQTYSLLSPTLVSMWHVSLANVGLVGSLTLLASALGGWITGILSDRFGRVIMLQVTVAWFCLFSLAMAFTHNMLEFSVLRVLQGFGFGGEWTAGAVLLGEQIGPRDRGRALSGVQAGYAPGQALAVALYAILFLVLPPTTAWRALLIVGALPAALIFFIRRNLKDPEVYLQARAARLQAREGLDIAQIFRPPLLSTTFWASLSTIGLQGGCYTLLIWLPTLLKTERGLSLLQTTAFLEVMTLGSLFGFLSAGAAADRIGRRRTLLVYGLLSMVTLAIYTLCPLPNILMLIGGFPLGFAVMGVFGVLPAFLCELYPTRIRATGQGFSYKIGRGVGALFPFFVGLLASRMSLAVAIAICGLIAHGLALIANLMLTETLGLDLVEADRNSGTAHPA
jgi:MFS family permease